MDIPTYTPKTGIGRWIDTRLPLPRLVYDSFVAYPVPRNLNYAYTFGGILSIMLVLQIITGIVLAMHYAPATSLAFDSVEHIMRDVNSGWLMRYLHANGASFFFIAVYLHIFRGLYYGFLQGAARAVVDPRRDHLPADDGHRLHGLRAAMGPDELLGCDRHHRLLYGHSAGRRIGPAASARWVSRSTTRRSTASSRCITSFPS